MSTLPRHEDAPPPAVAHVMDRLRTTRAFGWVRRHRNATATAAAGLIVLKSWRWALVGALRVLGHPRATLMMVQHHWQLAVVLSVGLFGIAFLAARLGIDWADRFASTREKLAELDEDVSKMPVGPAWAERPPDRTLNLPPRMG
jgi:hypothetical protein